MPTFSKWVPDATSRAVRDGLFALTVSLGLSMATAAQTAAPAPAGWPGKPIRLVVPFPAGGSVDSTSRALAQKLTEQLGQPVIVDNRPGAGGNIGMDVVAKSPPDGYTLGMGALSTHAVNPALFAKTPFDAVKDFAPVSLVVVTPNVLVINPQVLPASDVTGIAAFARSNPGKVNCASGSNGSAGHLACELFKLQTGAPIAHVPYKGGGPAMTDLLGGQVDLLCDQTTNTTGHLQSGKIKGYAVTTKTPVPSLPDLPTLDSSGVPGFEVAVWHGLYAPAGTPQQDIDKLAAALQGALKDPKVIERFAALGTEPVGADSATPAALDAHLKAEIARWKPVIEAAGVYAD